MNSGNIWMTGLLFMGLSAAVLSFGACGNSNPTPTESGAVVTSVYSNGTGSLCVGCYGGNQLTVTIQDSVGQAAFQLNPTSNGCDSSFQQIGNWLYEVQATCESQACTGDGVLLVAHQAVYGSTYGAGYSASGCSVEYNGSNYNNTGIGPVAYAKAFLYRRNINNVLALVNRVNGSWTSIIQAMPALESF
jgi:hypothetical protein